MRLKGHTLMESLLVMMMTMSFFMLTPVGRWLRYESSINQFQEAYLHRQYLAMLNHQYVELPNHAQLPESLYFNPKGNINRAYTLSFQTQHYSLSFITGRIYEKREQFD